MKYLKENKDVIVKVIGDVVIIGFYVSLTVIEWKVLGKISTGHLSKFEKAVYEACIGTGMIDNVIGAGRKAFDLVKTIRNRNDENNSKMEEFIKNSNKDFTKQLDAVMEVIDINEVFGTLSQFNPDNIETAE